MRSIFVIGPVTALATLVAVLALGACAARIDDNKAFWDNVRQVKVGMTKEEVSAILGPAQNVIIIGDVERRMYQYTALNGQHNWVTIPMREGKVLSVMTTTPEGTIR
jgi:hypothetical protein